MAKTVLTEDGRKAWNEYCRQYRKDHPEKMREIHNRYLNKRAERLAAAAAVEDGSDEKNEGD